MQRQWLVAGAVVIGMAIGGVTAGPAGTEETQAQQRRADLDVQAELRALRAEVDQLRAERETTWLNERRAEEVRALVHDVLADADTRAAFADGGVTAGHDGRFFIASDDGNHRLNIGGQIQLRYVANFRRRPEQGARTTSGFELRRTRLNFTGHVFDPRLTFQVQPEIRRTDGTMTVANLNVGYELTERLKITAGQKKAPFLREEMHSSGRLLAVDRSVFNNVFSGVWTVGAELEYEADALRAYAEVNQGFDGRVRGFEDHANTARVGLTGRGEWLVAGDWGQYDDFIAWSDAGSAMVIGAAGHYETNRVARFDGAFDDTLNFTTWTVDAALYYEQASLFAAFAGRHDVKVVSEGEAFDDYGLLVQGTYNVGDRIVPFGQYQWLIPDEDRGAHPIHLLTGGVNYYFHRHRAKLTADAIWALNALSGFYTGSGGVGLLPDRADRRNQLALRLQFQLLF